jgi:mycothiol synthase
MLSNFDVRPYRSEDAASVADLLNATSRVGGGSLELPPGAVASVVQAEVLDATLDTRLVRDAEGRLVAVALVRMPPDGGFRVTLEGGVHPDHRGLGIGRELLAWQLGRAAARHDELAPGVDWVAELDAGAGDTSATRLYDHLGFSIERFFLEMSAPTAPVRVSPAVPGAQIVPFDRSRARELHALHQAAFSGSWGYQRRGFESWAALTVESETFLPGLARVALSDGQSGTTVGFVLPYADGPHTLYIGQVGTAEAWRRRGVATALLAEVLQAADETGYVTVALETDSDSAAGATNVYERLGFAIKHRMVVYRKPI